VTLLAFAAESCAAEHHAVAHAEALVLLGTRRPPLISPSRLLGPQQQSHHIWRHKIGQTDRQTHKQTDGRTPYRYIHPVTYSASSVNKHSA